MKSINLEIEVLHIETVVQVNSVKNNAIQHIDYIILMKIMIIYV